MKNIKYVVILLLVSILLGACGSLPLPPGRETSSSDSTEAAVYCEINIAGQEMEFKEGHGFTLDAGHPGLAETFVCDRESGKMVRAEDGNPINVPGRIDLENHIFTPDWRGLNDRCPSFEQVLRDHGLTKAMLENEDQVDFLPEAPWEVCDYVIEFKKEFRGTVIPLLNGYFYNADPTDGDPIMLWGGDPLVEELALYHGTTFRWGPSYVNSRYGDWFDPNDPRELACRENRHGRYNRNAELEPLMPDVRYFDRVGPYNTRTGNLDVRGWVPPELDAVAPTNYMDACAMLGGRAVESEWSYGLMAAGGYYNWAWKYSDKIAGDPNYAQDWEPAWQTVYVPAESDGYVTIWLDSGQIGPDGKVVSTAGAYDFYVEDFLILMDGDHNVDEASWHLDPTLE